MSGVEFGLLGSTRVTVDGVPLKLPGAAERGLLAVLLLSAGTTLSASSLIDRLWSESALPADPLNALQLRVSKLRRVLGEHGLAIVERDGAGYRTDVEPARIDVHRFVSLIARARQFSRTGAPDAVGTYDDALALWRGDPLADFAGQGWATVEAARLWQLHAAAVTERAEAALAVGRHVEVAADLEPLVMQDLKQEALVGLLMTALYRSGRQADALELYARTRRALDDELGLEPSAALRSLHQRILKQAEDLAPPALPATGGHPAPRATPAVGEGAVVPRRRTLPVPTLRLIGRDRDLEQLQRALAEHRMVTLVGPGGAGKTSLALDVAHRIAGQFDDQVYLARLAAATTAGDVAIAVADALGVPLDGADPNAAVRSRVVSFLANRHALLVIDNCEHVIDAVATLADSVLAAAGRVTVLATSREALAVRGEVQVSVAPLGVPPVGTASADVPSFAAAALFLERASAVRPDLQLSEDDARALVDVCHQLDGMPLALELAAARVSALSLPELAIRLKDRFNLLTTGPRTAEARQRTLRATVEWSHALLSPEEQLVFRRLAVFHGGWTLDAAEGVVPGEELDPALVLDVLDRLVHRSMISADIGARTRYRMLETLRQYAGDELTAAGERDDLASRHAAYFRQLGEHAELGLRGLEQRATLALLREEHPNIRAALAWLSAHPDRIEDGLRLGGALALFWHLGRHVEGREVLHQLVETSGGSRTARARALQAVSIVERPRACLVHPSPRCAETAKQSLELFLAEGDLHRAALSKVLLAVELLDGRNPDEFAELLTDAESQFASADDDWGHAVVALVRLQYYLRGGEEARARAMGRTAREAFRRLDDAWGLSAVLYHLGWGLKEFGRCAEAVPVLEQAIEVAASAGVLNTVQWALSDLGMALLALGERASAAAAFDRAAAASEEVGDAAGVVLAALGRATMAQGDGDSAMARPLFEEAARGLTRLRTPLWAGLATAGVAWCDWREGLLDDAEGRYRDVRDSGDQLGEASLVALALEGFARVAAARDDQRAAESLLREASELRQRWGRPAPPHERAELEGLLVVNSKPRAGLTAR